MQRLIALSETNLILRILLQLGRQHEGCRYIAVRLVSVDVISIGSKETHSFSKTAKLWVK